ncbi:MAG: hypothetical protein LBU39_01435, partial [Desulfobulbaceae bacterium]|nr:hypothetical protein [Desulfobulbaceae bacterium]
TKVASSLPQTSSFHNLSSVPRSAKRRETDLLPNPTTNRQLLFLRYFKKIHPLTLHLRCPARAPSKAN